MTFYDHFSHNAAAYRESRPHYPDALFDWIASAAPATGLVWDCGCGNGQASVPLAARFDRVVATDASKKQLDQAVQAPGIEYRLGTAEDSGLGARSADAVTVAQAAHWFDHKAFHKEVRRVLKPGGLLAMWSYALNTVNPDFDKVTAVFYNEVVGPYWPPRRSHVESKYKTLPFPFKKIKTPNFAMVHEWTLDQVIDYYRTWSATKGFVESNGTDPLALVEAEFLAAWGDTKKPQRVTWPLTVVAGYAPGR
ncbi:MAG TPA: class I SAM-dependent methyltransferase [Fimbriimonadaceae bacterium]|nr:class I SAM-dependent methyltransferase [Fimbriimonadaceae bacterium]